MAVFGLVDLAWREWRENQSWRGASPDATEMEPGRWFWLGELGHALDSGPSLTWTCSTLAKENRSALKQLGAEAPLRVTYPKDFDRDPRSRSLTVKRCRLAAGASRILKWVPMGNPNERARRAAKALVKFLRGGVA